ncbi:hypothetical protein KHA80_08535 [Anaerobacillus sp. HL2]|nr:hypothetical protein KHA80_08535 [Anaerobacillus sp. HL2]
MENFKQLFSLNFIVVILTFLFVDFFDTAGTMYAVANQAGFVKDNKLPRAERALLADSSATSIGAILGTSTTTAYIESSARGSSSWWSYGFCFCYNCILIYHSFILLSFISYFYGRSVSNGSTYYCWDINGASLSQIDWSKFELAVPSFLTVLTMPLAYSIADGIALELFSILLQWLQKEGQKRFIRLCMYCL